MMETSGGAKKCTTLKKESYEDVEETYLWFLQERSRGTPLSRPIPAKKALLFFRRLSVDASVNDYKASQGWPEEFKQCHGICQLQVVRKKLSAYLQEWLTTDKMNQGALH